MMKINQFPLFKDQISRKFRKLQIYREISLSNSCQNLWTCRIEHCEITLIESKSKLSRTNKIENNGRMFEDTNTLLTLFAQVIFFISVFSALELCLTCS